MARKRSSGKAGKRVKRAAPRKRTSSKARTAAPSAVGAASADPIRLVVQEGMHDLTNLATSLTVYLELLDSQGTLEEKQKYYVNRTREQVEMMVDLVREMREKIG